MKIMNTDTGTVAIDWQSLGNGTFRLYGMGINATVTHRWNGQEWVTKLVSGHIPLDADRLHRWCCWNIA